MPVEPVRQPSLVQDAYLKASNTSAGDQFGYSIAVSADGSTLAVGAPGESSSDPMNQSDSGASSSGAVYVFLREGSSWIQWGYLKAPTPEVSAMFGTSVALSADGKILAVGAPLESPPELDGAGAVYVFDGPMFMQRLQASNAGSESCQDPFSCPADAPDNFGMTVALSADGRVLAVGAPGEDSDAKGINADQLNNRALDSGAAYVFVSDGVSWRQDAYLKPSNTGEFDYFGGRIALSGDGLSLAVGASLEDGDGTGINPPTNELGTDSGAVYVFGASPGWTQQAYLKASNTNDDDRFGSSVALSRDGSVLAVGATDEDSSEAGAGGSGVDNQLGNSGAAYVFVRSTVGQAPMWHQQAYLKASNPGAVDDFGFSVALSADGSSLAVGAPYEDSSSSGVDSGQADDSYSNAGAAYVFENSGGSWQQLGYLKPSNPGHDEEFGHRVALPGDGSWVAVSAWKEAGAARGVNGNPDDKSLEGAGAAYVFERN